MHTPATYQPDNENKDTVVEVFKTNVNSKSATQSIIHQLEEIVPGAKINFDLEDCDKILRVETSYPGADVGPLMECVKKMNFKIEILL